MILKWDDKYCFINWSITMYVGLKFYDNSLTQWASSITMKFILPIYEMKNAKSF